MSLVRIFHGKFCAFGETPPRGAGAQNLVIFLEGQYELTLNTTSVYQCFE